MTQLLSLYETWLILGLALIALDMLVDLDFFALTFGIGAVATGITILFEDALPITLSDSWQMSLVYFGVVSVVILIPSRRWLNKSKAEGGSDINDY